MNFSEGHEGIALLAESIFKAGQTIPYGVSINRKSYLPMKTAIHSSMDKMVGEWRESFKTYLKNELLGSWGAVSIDRVTLKMQGRNFLDFTMHHVDMKKGNSILERPKSSIISSTVLFVEAPDVSSGCNKRAIFEENLRSL